jgi:hypothetical protein
LLTDRWRDPHHEVLRSENMMQPLIGGREKPLAGCAGYAAIGNDGFIGFVETPLFPDDLAEPDFLVLRVGNWPAMRRPVVSTTRVNDVDVEGRIVWLDGRRHELANLPQRLPIAL